MTMNNTILAATTSETMETTMNDDAAFLALTTNVDKFSPLVEIAIAARVIACAGGKYRKSIEDAIWAVTPALASLNAEELAVVKYGVELVDCVDPGVPLGALVRESLEMFLEGSEEAAA